MSAVAGPGTLARFQLLRELGRGAQATVMLAHDPRLDREVALKLLNPGADADAVSEWLNEARAVSGLKHPNIVPLFEADTHEGQPYLVFEYVEGPTLAQARRGKGALGAREAVALLLDVLDALAEAHAQGLVHRDLKPSNILLGGDGRARVMDFGIAARVAPRTTRKSHAADAAAGRKSHDMDAVSGRKSGDADAASGRKSGDADAASGRIVGTAGYMSPEAARGEPPVAAMDVFAAGVMLGELLSGAPLLRETDPYRAVQRIQVEDMLLPAHVKVDQTLRGIVQRALARDVLARYDSARSMHRALSAWLHPAGAAQPDAASVAAKPGGHSTLDFLLRRMRHKTDFPALSASIVRIQRVAMSETESLKSLTDEILKDVALTNKLLRMVNTAHFTSASGEGIGTVSRAVALVGFAGIRNMALSVILLEHMGDKAHAAQLKEEFLRALMAGTLAEALSPIAREGEDAFLCALFQNLGRLLTECYFPEEAVQVRQHLGAAALAGDAVEAAREAASQRVLGLGFDELGAGVAKAWGLPESLQRALRRPDGDVPARPVERGNDRGSERMRWLARGANALADAMLSGDGDAQTQALQQAAEAYAPALGLAVRDVIAAAHTARQRVTQLASAMQLQVAARAPARRLLESPRGAAPGGGAVLADATLLLPAAADAAPYATAARVPGSGVAGLTQALADVREAAARQPPRTNALLTQVLQTVQQLLQFRRVVFCLREPASGQLVGRLGFGDGAADGAAAFRFAPDASAAGNLFAWLCAKGADLLVSDAKTVAARLPAWYRQHAAAPTFLLLPMMRKGAPIGLIYADKAVAGSIVLTDEELALLRALRDQLACALSG